MNPSGTDACLGSACAACSGSDSATWESDSPSLWVPFSEASEEDDESERGDSLPELALSMGQLQQPLPDAASCNSRYKQCLMQRIEGETELHVCSSMGRNSYEAMASTVSVGMRMRMDVWISRQ